MKSRVLILILCLVLAIIFSACTVTTPSSESSNSGVGTTESSKNNFTKRDESEEITSTPEHKNEIKYADDVVVNRFISEFNSTSKYEFSDIRKGNIRTKYFGNANGCYIEMINANDAGAKCFSVKINGGQEIADRDRMFETFGEVIKVLDPTITDSKAVEVVNNLKSQKYMTSDYVISNDVMIETYVPIVELSYGKSACRIDVISKNYK